MDNASRASAADLVKRLYRTEEPIFEARLRASSAGRYDDDVSVAVSLPAERRISFRLKEAPEGRDGTPCFPPGPDFELLSLGIGDIKRMSPLVRRMFAPGGRGTCAGVYLDPDLALREMANWASWYEEGVRQGEFQAA
ncbi:MAG: hypothetical protein ABSH01_30165 [Terriglobia bacterium]|jgi:hypothetical protein